MNNLNILLFLSALIYTHLYTYDIKYIHAYIITYIYIHSYIHFLLTHALMHANKYAHTHRHTHTQGAAQPISMRIQDFLREGSEYRGRSLKQEELRAQPPEAMECFILITPKS